MPTIKLRSVKGSPLTNDEVDSSFNTLNVYKVEQTDSTGSALIPKGTTAQRDASPTTGALRYNTDSAAFEGYTGSAWVPVGRSLSVTDAGGDGSLAYNSETGVLTYTGPSASEVRAHLNVLDAGGDGSFAYDSASGKFTYTGPSASEVRAHLNVLDAGGDGSFAYDSASGKFTYTGPSASEVRAHLSAGGDLAYNSSTGVFSFTERTDAEVRGLVSATDAGGDGSFSYNSSTGAFTYTGPSASEVRAHLNVLDAGGDGSFAYDSASGKFTYTGPSASEVRAHFTGGTGVTITDGSIAIGQAVATTSDVTFAKIVGDSASLGQVSFKTDWADSHIPFEEGALWYDPHHKNLNYYTDFDHPIELGMQIVERVFNDTGSTITKGAPLYYSGNKTTDLGRECPTVALADATSASAYNVQGLAAEDIPNNSYGQIVVAGVIDDFDTSGLTAGQNFFAGLTPGALQNAAPSYPNYPMCLGWVIKSDATTGQVIVNQQNHSVNTFRVQGATHIGDNLIVDGNLTVVGTQTITSTENVQIGGAIQYLNAGNTIGEAGTTFVGTGLDDAFYSGHYSGDSATKSFFVKIDATGTPDTFEWGFDSSVGTQATGVAITGAAQMLDSAYGISIDFGATTGHTLNDKWTGTATAVNVDTGLFSNRNAGSNYTHVGFFFDVSTNKWRLLDALDSEPSQTINLSSPTISYGDLVANQFEGAVVGNVTGNVTGNASSATTLQTSRDFSISGDVTASAVSFNGSGNVTLSAAITSGAIVNDDINASAAIADTKLATISTAGKVSNSATTATSNNTNSAIVARDGSGNFSAGVITADFNRSANTTVSAGTYGSGSLVPVLTVDSSGFIDSIGSVSVAGVSGVAWDSATAIYTISTADGNSYPKKIVPNSSFISHDNTTGFVADEHIAHSGVTLTAGNGLTGGGDISASRSFAVGPGVGIKVAADTVSIDSSEVVNYALPIRALFSGSAGVNYNSTTGAFDVNEAAVNHDTLSNFVANEHINHTSVTLTAGNGLTGGGDISASRSFAVGPGVGIKVAADTVSIDSAEVVNYALPIRALFSGSAGVNYNSTTGAFDVNEGAVDHDTLSNFVANEHINHTSVSITAGNGLTGGGTIAATRTIAVGPGTGIKVAADTVSIDSAEISLYAPPIRALFSGSAGVNYNSTTGAFDVDEANVIHDNLSGFVANEHINHTSVTLTAGNGLTGGGDISANRTFAVGAGTGITVNANDVAVNAGAVNHDALLNFVSDEHIAHSGVSITAGNGLTGGGTIAASRTINVGAGTGITVNANDVAINGAQIFTDLLTRDGAGTGLDADLLDGQHGSYYRIDVYNSAGSLLN